jgi:hypothetical protein
VPTKQDIRCNGKPLCLEYTVSRIAFFAFPNLLKTITGFLSLSFIIKSNRTFSQSPESGQIFAVLEEILFHLRANAEFLSIPRVASILPAVIFTLKIAVSVFFLNYCLKTFIAEIRDKISKKKALARQFAARKISASSLSTPTLKVQHQSIVATV